MKWYLTLTSVVFEFIKFVASAIVAMNLTLTSVVFEYYFQALFFLL